MPIQWAGLSPELLLALDRDAAEPLRAQLERGLRDAIRSGRLATGERLPSSRALARELELSRGLVLDCYTQLQAEGYLTASTGSATRVAGGAQDVPAVPAPRRGPGGGPPGHDLPPRPAGPAPFPPGGRGWGRRGGRPP